MTTRKAAAVIAGLVLAIGLLLLFVPVSVAGDVDCGSAVAPDSIGAIGAEFSDALNGRSTDYQVMCDERVSTQRLIAFSIAGIGALALLFVVLTAARADPVTKPE